MSTKGVVYYNRGNKCILRLIISLYSLRKHYKGPVCILHDGTPDPALVDSLKKDLDVDVLVDSDAGASTLVRKVKISTKTPYDTTVFIDADTLIVGSIDELFQMAEKPGCDLVAVHFAGWKTNGRTIMRRIKGFKPEYPKYIQPAIDFGPAINTGVYAYTKTSKMFDEWFEVAKWGSQEGLFIPDEIACQVLAPKYNVEIAPSKFNVSCNYGVNEADKRVIHYHGSKHVKSKLAGLWLEAFKKCLESNLCGIKSYCKDGFLGDRRLRKFIGGRYGNLNYVSAIKRLLSSSKPQEAQSTESILPNVTIVTACDVKYVEHLRATFKNWVKYKSALSYPMIVYVNGLAKGSPELDFLNVHPNLKVIEWSFEAETQRERMLSAFVFGTARDVETEYWVKLDADAYATNDSPLLTAEMLDYVICGHKWHYTKPWKWIQDLDEWAASKRGLDGTSSIFDKKSVNGRRYSHDRVASYVQLHKSSFVRTAAALAGKRLPVPSHDTYLWYIAKRMGMPIMRHNFKRFRGMTNKSDLTSLKAKLKEVEDIHG